MSKPFPALVPDPAIRQRIIRVHDRLHLNRPLFLLRSAELSALAARIHLGGVLAADRDIEGRPVLTPLQDATDGCALPWVIRLYTKETEETRIPSQIHLHLPVGERPPYHGLVRMRDTDGFERDLKRELERMLDLIPMLVATEQMHREMGIRKTSIPDPRAYPHPFEWAPWAKEALRMVEPYLEFDPILDPYADEEERWEEDDEPEFLRGWFSGPLPEEEETDEE